MQFSDVISPDRSFVDTLGNSKKRVLENASELIGKNLNSLDSEEIFTGLINRERLGSTGLGDGVAIPHCRLDNCPETFGTLIRLPEPIDYDAIDNKPVDLLFVLLVPSEATDDHLQTLASAAELFSQEKFRNALRNCLSAEDLYQTALSFAE